MRMRSLAVLLALTPGLAARAQERGGPGADVDPRRPYPYRSPAVAFGCSLVVPGLGQMYNGDVAKGLIVFFASVGLMTTATMTDYFDSDDSAELAVALGGAAYVYGIVDAPIRAGRVNAQSGFVVGASDEGVSTQQYAGLVPPPVLPRHAPARPQGMGAVASPLPAPLPVAPAAPLPTPPADSVPAVPPALAECHALVEHVCSCETTLAPRSRDLLCQRARATEQAQSSDPSGCVALVQGIVRLASCAQ